MRALFFLSVAELVWRGTIPPQRGGERVGRAGCGKTIVAGQNFTDLNGLA